MPTAGWHSRSSPRSVRALEPDQAPRCWSGTASGCWSSSTRPAGTCWDGVGVYRTVEWVTPQEPDGIEFEGVEGPLTMLWDRFDLADEGGCTRLDYRSEFGLVGWVFGWLISRLVVRRMLHRTMEEHLEEMRETIEARARRSKVFPQRPCSIGDAGP